MEIGSKSEKERVCLSACRTYDFGEVRSVLCRQFDALEVNGLLFPGCRVVIKPNLVIKSKPEEAVITHPVVVAAAAVELKARGAGSVTVAESPGGPYTPGLLRGIYQAGGYTELAQKYGFALNLDCAYTEFSAPEGRRSRLFTGINPILEADVVVNIAKLKTHGMMGLSAAVKNLFGTVPGLMKPELHCRFPERTAFAEMLVDLCCTLKPQLNLVDGVMAMEGNGPSGGTPRFVGALLASRNPFAADVVCATLIHQTPEQNLILKLGMDRGVCPKNLEEIDLWGADPQALAVADFVQPDTKNVDFLMKVPAFLRPLATKLTTPLPRIRRAECVGCGKCAESCPQHTIQILDGKAEIQYKDCIRCYCCHEMCPKHVIDIKRFRLFKW